MFSVLRGVLVISIKSFLILFVSCLTFFVSSPVQSEEQMRIRGMTDCGKWVSSRKNGTSNAYEFGLSGFLSGMQLRQPVKNFWHSKKGNLSFQKGLSITDEQVFLWMDKYCRENPLKNLTDGAIEVFSTHASIFKLRPVK